MRMNSSFKKVRCIRTGSINLVFFQRTCLFLIFFLIIQISNSKVVAQLFTLTLDMRNVPVEKVLNAIEAKTAYSFLYNKQLIDVERRVQIKVKNRDLNSVLTELFEDTNVIFTITGKQIVLSKKNNEKSDEQHSLIINGKVVDDKGDPLIGVNVKVKGTTSGSITDVNGKFSVPVLSVKSPILVFTYIGYDTQEVSFKGQTLRVVLTEGTKSLDEVVVIGFGSVGKRELTSAVSHINSSDLIQSGNTNALMSIQGRVSGLSITNTGGSDPNSGPSIQLRGVSSRDAGSSPLIVIDGVSGGNIENLNSNDIASIDVLKDGAASAIYGTQGSAGVIVVTTKKGSSGAMATTYSGYTSVDFVNHEAKTLSAADFVKNNRGTNYGGNTEWLNAVTRDYAFTHSHAISVSGGWGNSNYRATVDYRKATGLDLRSDREEYGARISLNHTQSNGLYKMSLNLAPRYIRKNNANYEVFTQALTLNPTYSIKDSNNPNMYTAITGSDGQFNPVELLKLEKSGTEGKLLDWDGTFKLNITKDLSSQVTLSQSTQDYFDFWFRPSTMTSEIQSGYTGEASRAYNKWDHKSLEWLTNYSLNVNEHSMKAMVGYSYQYFSKEGMSAENKNFTSDAPTYDNLGDGLYQQVEGRNGMGSYKEDSKLIALFGRISYSYDDKYLGTVSLRHEGSTKFGTNNKWGNFPAVSVGWRVSKESFMKDITWVNDLKLRADYGVTGNQNFGNYLSLSTYGGYGYYFFNGKYYQVWGPANNTNTNLKWEKGKNMNVGLDFSVLNNRIEGSVNYYNRTQQDLLGWYNAPVPPNPQVQTYANVGSMRNAGFELDMNVKVVNKKGFSYQIGVVGATNDNKFLSFSNNIFQGQNYVDMAGLPAPGTPGPAQRLQEGERIGNFYMWKFAGVDQNGSMLVYNKDNKAIQANVATNDDKRIVGNGLPKFTASMNHTFKYSNWDLALYLRGVFGYDIFNVQEFYYGLQSTPAGSNAFASAYTKNAPIKGDKVLCDYFLEKGDYVKLDVVSLGYTVKSNFKCFSSIRIYATGKNLATITGFSGIDPQAYPVNGLTPGITGGKSYYPSTAQVLFGAQISF